MTASTSLPRDLTAGEYRLPTAADTHAFGVRLADALRGGDLVVLTGPLGAGKTALAAGIGAGLGVRGRVTSPTFILARVHEGGRVPMVHVDAYRLGGMDPSGGVDLGADIDALDLDVTLDEAVTVVEWGGEVASRLTTSYLEVVLDREVGGDVRTARLVPHGQRDAGRLAD